MGNYKGDQTTGFQSPAQDYVEGVVDLAAMLDLRRPNRYYKASPSGPPTPRRLVGDTRRFHRAIGGTR